MPYKYCDPLEIGYIVDAWALSDWDNVERLSDKMCGKKMLMKTVKVQGLVDRLLKARDTATEKERADQLIDEVILSLKRYQGGIMELEK
jgi:hypothetical protein